MNLVSVKWPQDARVMTGLLFSQPPDLDGELGGEIMESLKRFSQPFCCQETRDFHIAIGRTGRTGTCYEKCEEQDQAIQ